jgi:hypothetical protein
LSESIRQILGVFATALTIIGYLPYLYDCYKGKTTPHFFSWSLWTLSNTIVFFFLLLEGGGPAAWPIGMMSIMFSFTLYFSLQAKSRKRIKKVDILLFIIGLLAIPIWLIADNPLIAISIVSLIELAAFIPTLRKTIEFPFEETLSSYAIAAFKYSLILIILDQYSLKLLVNPIMWWIINVGFALLIIYLRKNKNARIA